MENCNILILNHSPNKRFADIVQYTISKHYKKLIPVSYSVYGNTAESDLDPADFKNMVKNASAVIVLLYQNQGGSQDTVPAEIDIIRKNKNIPIFFITADATKPAAYLSQYGYLNVAVADVLSHDTLDELALKIKSGLDPMFEKLIADEPSTAIAGKMTADDYSNLGFSYSAIAKILTDRGRDDLAVEYMISAGENAALTYETVKHFSLLNRMLICFGPAGDISFQNKKYDTAAYCYEKAFDACLECERIRREDRSIKQLINCFKKYTRLIPGNDPEKLASVYRKTAEACREHNEFVQDIDALDMAAFLYLKLSNIYTQAKEFQPALEASLLSLGIRKEMLEDGNPEYERLYSVTEENTGKCYMALGLNGKAEACLDDAITRLRGLFEKTGNPGYAFDLTVILLTAAEVQFAVYNIADGREYCNKAIRLRQLLAEKRGSKEDILNLSYAYYTSAQLEHSVGIDDFAMERIKAAEELAERLVIRESSEDNNDLLLKVYLMIISLTTDEKIRQDYAAKGSIQCQRLYTETENEKYKKLSQAFKPTKNG